LVSRCPICAAVFIASPYFEDLLHLWPDASLTSEAQFLKMREAIFRRNFPEAKETRKETAKRRRADLRSFKQHLAWVNRWHARVSEWPGQKRSKRWKIPTLPGETAPRNGADLLAVKL